MTASSLAAILRPSGDGGAWNGILDDALVEGARQHDIGPLVYHALSRRGLLDSQPSGVRDALAKMSCEAALLDALRREEIRSVLGDLAAADLAPLVFKGAALAHLHYPEPWLRPRVDTDLFIREDTQAETAAVFERMGFTRMARPSGEHVTHQFTYVGAVRGVRTAYDIHWKIADPQVFADVFSYPELASESVPVTPLGPHARAIGDLHALLVACTHRVAHHYDTESLLLLYDIDLIARRLDARAWSRVVALACEKRIRAVSARGLCLATTFFGAPVPAEVLSALNNGDEFEPTAAYLRRDLRRVDILSSDLKALGGWRARATLLREHLLPPPAYILKSYGQTSRVVLPALYLHRLVRGVLEWFRPLR